MTKNNYLIRPMQAADLSAVLLIEQEQNFPWALGMLQDCLAAHYECWVLVVKQEIIGFIILACAMQQADILNVAIKAKYHRQGYGQLLLQHVIELAQQQQVKQLFLEVRVSNLAAIRLYEKLHFIQVGNRARYYPAEQGAKEDGIVMRLDF